MKTLFAASAVFASLMTAPLSAQDDADAAGLTEGEAELAEMLEGRVAGEPTNCINTFGSRSLEIIDDTAIVYRNGGTIWVNYTRNPDTLDEDDILVIRKYGSGSRLCRLDSVTTRDRFSLFFSGAIFLDDFIPYRLPEDAERTDG